MKDFWKKNKTMIIVGAVILVLLVVMFVVWMNWSSDPKDEGASQRSGSGSGSGSGSHSSGSGSGSHSSGSGSGTGSGSGSGSPKPPSSTVTTTGTNSSWTDSNYTGKTVYAKLKGVEFSRPVWDKQYAVRAADANDELGTATGKMFRVNGMNFMEYKPAWRLGTFTFSLLYYPFAATSSV